MKLISYCLPLWVAITDAFVLTPSSSFQRHRLATTTTATTTTTAKAPRQWREVYPQSIRRATVRRAASTNDEAFDDTCDVLILGSGPAARAMASLLAASYNVLMADQRVDTEFVPNYGVWQDEWQAVVDRYAAAGVSLDGSIDRTWLQTDCFFGGSFNKPFDERLRLDRPYCRVDRFALRRALSSSYRTVAANHISQAIAVNLYEPAGSLVHDADGTTIQLERADGSRTTIRTRLVVDCTGHETKLVLRDDSPSAPPGFQIAYGALVQVDESNNNDDDKSMIGPYDKECMTLFDYRTDHFDANDDDLQRKVSQAPTFMYAMPLQDDLIFFEETSLVARPAVSFQDCKDRCIQRLKFHNIRVKDVLEEEFCYIPMGGALPAKNQRVIGLGGAAAMVHPSTGYHLCRCMMAAADMAQAIRQSDDTAASLDQTAAAAYAAAWSPDNIRQRNFAVFGGEFLMKQDVVGLRGFFDGFFKLPLPLWAGFLAGWPGLPNNDQHETWWARLWYGLNFIVRIPPPVAVDMVASILTYSALETTTLLQSVTPFFGQPASYDYPPNRDGVGDVAAKQEARDMIQASKVTMDLPKFFDSSYGTTVDDSVVPDEELPFVVVNGAAAVNEETVAVPVAVPEEGPEEDTTEDVVNGETIGSTEPVVFNGAPTNGESITPNGSTQPVMFVNGSTEPVSLNGDEEQQQKELADQSRKIAFRAQQQELLRRSLLQARLAAEQQQPKGNTPNGEN